MIRIPILSPGHRQAFPPVDRALVEPNGLLCAGGDLSPTRLIDAYRHGIFPWFNEGEAILWWSPDPRLVFDPITTWPNRRLARWFRQCPWTITADRAFGRVMRACAAPRSYSRDTWIGAPMLAAYGRLHELGVAHSVEVWEADTLIGGIYGVALGRAFFGESMFSTRSQASKLAFYALTAGLRAKGFELLDGQVESAHLSSLGGVLMPRAEFAVRLGKLCAEIPSGGSWHADWPVDSARSALLNRPAAWTPDQSLSSSVG